MTPGTSGTRRRAWAELLRVSALFTVPGDALAGAAAAGLRPNRRTALAIGSSLCLYEAGMALNDWADRDEDAADRPHRPIPSGRVTPPAALAAATALTATGLTLAARAGRAPLAVATALAGTVWAYDLHLKHTRAAPATMATARALDLLLGAAATAHAAPRRAGDPKRGAHRAAGAAAPAPVRGTTAPTAGHAGLSALPSAAMLAAHTYAVTAVSRHEAHGGSTAVPLAALAATAALGALVTRARPAERQATARPATARPATGTGGSTGTWGVRGTAGTRGSTGTGGAIGVPPSAGRRSRRARGVPARPARRARGGPVRPAHRSPVRLAEGAGRAVTALAATAYLRTAGVPFLHAALNPSAPLTQRAVGGGIRAMIPLQAALAARGGAPATGLAVMGLAPLARTLARKVSPT
ncbi:SCO3242 family prenyltransferase [Streptomyces sp. NPDC006368]|uniref:SCO3242 family prenyltransferase n=1 Tax=Streptomyces sp. NPDC006368 TaxID=3156760 RepID=UPI0033BB9E0F